MQLDILLLRSESVLFSHYYLSPSEDVKEILITGKKVLWKTHSASMFSAVFPPGKHNPLLKKEICEDWLKILLRSLTEKKIIYVNFHFFSLPVFLCHHITLSNNVFPPMEAWLHLAKAGVVVGRGMDSVECTYIGLMHFAHACWVNLPVSFHCHL